MTWEPVGDVIKRTKTINEHSQGCRDCGTVMQTTTPSGFTAYYPGVECCPPALRRQIQWRSQEIDTVNRKLQERQDAVTHIRDEINLAPSRSAAAAAEAKLTRAERNLAISMREHFTPQLRELSKEIARLKNKLRQLEAAA